MQLGHFVIAEILDRVPFICQLLCQGSDFTGVARLQTDKTWALLLLRSDN